MVQVDFLYSGLLQLKERYEIAGPEPRNNLDIACKYDVNRMSPVDVWMTGPSAEGSMTRKISSTLNWITGAMSSYPWI